jgi:Na+-driven multidrug efflux pump
MGLQFSITGIGIIMLQSANNALGTVCVASFTAAMRVKYFFTSVFENIGVAMATYCGQNIGARKVPRIALGTWAAMGITMVYFLGIFTIIQLFADEMMMLFVDESQTAIIHNAAMLMRISSWFYPVLGQLTILRYSIQGLGWSGLSMMSGVMEMIARGAVSIWLVPAWGFLGVCYGDPLAWIAADLFLVPAMLWLYGRLSKATQRHR